MSREGAGCLVGCGYCLKAVGCLLVLVAGVIAALVLVGMAARPPG